jgi:murein DD-endopeptidase MepM/ murein hydrolase activator NlpD
LNECQENEMDRINRMAQSSVLSLLRWAAKQGGRLLKMALKRLIPAILSYLSPIAVPILLTIAAFVIVYAANFMLPRWIMGGGTGPINPNTVGVLQVTVTGYTTGSTATGVTPQTGVAAVDPSVIAYGTRVYIQGYGNAIALDTNSATKGDDIAVYFSTAAGAKSWGKQAKTIELLGTGPIQTNSAAITTDASNTGSVDVLSYGQTDTTWPLAKDQQLMNTYLGLDSSWLNNYQSPVALDSATPDSASGNAANPSMTVGQIWASWMNQIPSESEQAYPYRVPWSLMAAMDKIAGEQNFIATNVPGTQGDGRTSLFLNNKNADKNFAALSPTLAWQTFMLSYSRHWTETDSQGKSHSYSETYTKNIRLLTSADCYDADYQYQWTSQTISSPSGDTSDQWQVTIPVVKLLTRTGPYYQRLKNILAEPQYGLTSEMDLQLLLQCAQSLDQGYAIDSWLFGTPLEMDMNSENDTGSPGTFQFMPVANATTVVPYGMFYNQALGKLAMNPGVDLSDGYGETVNSVAAGTVVFTGEYGSDGNAIMIDHGNCRTLYADLSKISVQVGQQVAAGQAIGQAGMPYLHFEVRTGKGETEYLNPTDFLPSMAWGTQYEQYVSPKALQYTPVNEQAILAFLQAQNSSPAFANMTEIDAIINAAQAHDINPLLLFAITGAEQSFVSIYRDTPTDNVRIAMNPFNVTGCWEDTSFPIQTSADMTANFLAERLSQAPPAGENAIAWINDPANPNGGLYASKPDGSPSPSWVPNVIGFFNMLSNWSSIY